MNRRPTSIALGLCLALASGRATADVARTARAVRATREIVVDGRLDEPDWAEVPAVGDFVQLAPDFGTPPHQPTIARVLFDDEALYVGFDCRDDAPLEIVSRLARRDQFPESDRVSVYLDGLGDGRSGFELTVNVAGVLSDAVLSGDTGNDRSWDGTWTAETSRDGSGWTAEIRIPFRILRWREGDGRAWGMQLARVVARDREVSAWQPIPQGSGTFVSSFGRLEGLEPPRAQIPLEIRPYALGRLGLGRADGSIAPEDTVSGEIGVDAHLAPSPDFSVDGTFNPDFGQVELDPQVVNLSPYETFFPERRPFFLEGIEVFRTPLNLVHTRRIGGAPGVPDAPDGDEIAEIPETTRIWGATKATGEAAPGTSVGLLGAWTDRVVAETSRGSAVLAERPRLFFAGRAREQLAGTSTVGLLATNVSSLGEREHATVGAADWDLRSSGREWRVWGQVAGERQDRPGEPAGDGWATGLGFARVGGETLRPEVTVDFIGPGFDGNDLGFVSRDDQLTLGAWLAAVRERPWGPARIANLGVGADLVRNTEGDLLGQGQSISGFLVFRNMWSLHANAGFSQAHVDDLESRGGPNVERPGNRSVWISFDTDFSKRVYGGAGTGVERRTGAPFLDQFAWVVVRPIDAVEVGVDFDYRLHDGWDHYVDTETDALDVDHYVFGSLSIVQMSSTLRTLLVLSRDVTFQVYAQLLRAIGDSSRYRELATNGRLFAPATPHADDADFDTTGVSLQAVARWELWPGSAAYLVYRHQISTDAVPSSGSLSDGRDPFFAHLVDGGDDVLLAKMTLLWWP